MLYEDNFSFSTTVETIIKIDENSDEVLGSTQHKTFLGSEIPLE